MLTRITFMPRNQSLFSQFMKHWLPFMFMGLLAVSGCYVAIMKVLHPEYNVTASISVITPVVIMMGSVVTVVKDWYSKNKL